MAAIALALAAGPARYEVPAEPRESERIEGATGSWAVYVAIAPFGDGGAGCEVVWTRLLSLLLGGTVYTFSLILAVFLVGLGIGSSLGAFLGRRPASARVALGACQWLLTAAIAWTAVIISDSLPYWPVVPGCHKAPGTPFSSISCAAAGPSCCPRACGGLASRWRWRLLPLAVRTREGWSAAFTRPTR